VRGSAENSDFNLRFGRNATDFGLRCLLKEPAMSNDDDSPNYALIPADFPSVRILSSLSGTADKLLVREFEGRYYQLGASPPERYARWRQCTELADFFVMKCRENENGKYAHLSRPQILDQYFVRLIAEGYGTPQEMAWVIRETASKLEWLVPDIASEAVAAKVPHCDLVGDKTTIAEAVRYLEALSSVQGIATHDVKPKNT
jgi:hypothetical protein